MRSLLVNSKRKISKWRARFTTGMSYTLCELCACQQDKIRRPQSKWISYRSRQNKTRQTFSPPRSYRDTKPDIDIDKERDVDIEIEGGIDTAILDIDVDRDYIIDR